MLEHRNLYPCLDLILVSFGKKRKTCYNKARLDGTKSSWDMFKETRTAYNDCFKCKRKDFFSRQADNLVLSPRNFWSTVKPVMKPNESNPVDALRINGDVVTSRQLIVSHFANVFSVALISTAKLSILACAAFMKQHFENQTFTGPSFKLKLGTLREDQVLDALLRLDPQSGSGYAGIPARVLKKCANDLNDMMTDMFNLCISENQIPSCWKKALVRPHYKGKGDIYRSISLIFPIAKIFESLTKQ